jgi:hypothetical protein
LRTERFTASRPLPRSFSVSGLGPGLAAFFCRSVAAFLSDNWFSPAAGCGFVLLRL